MKTFGEYVTSVPVPRSRTARASAHSSVVGASTSAKGSIAGAYATDLRTRPGRKRGMRRAWACLVVLVLAGCGGSADIQPSAPRADSGTLSADGITVDLPDGWTGRI